MLIAAQPAQKNGARSPTIDSLCPGRVITGD